jgi:hypothetical protein
MASVEPATAARAVAPDIHRPLSGHTATEALSSGVSWAAVIAGSAVAAALSLSLLVLGTGLGFTAVSQWAGEGVSAEGIGIASLVWVILMQLIAGAMGGYLAGRLRTKWTNLHTDEVFFRDTAHGFLVWAVGLVITAAFLVSASSAIIGGTAQAGAAAAGATLATGGAAVAAGANDQVEESASGAINYLTDMLFRQERPGAGDADRADIRTEALRILANGWEDMPDIDRTYLARLIADNTGITQAQAESRIRDVQAQIAELENEAREAADAARSALAQVSLWMFLGLLIGAFSASFAATIGGRQRDNVHA